MKLSIWATMILGAASMAFAQPPAGGAPAGGRGGGRGGFQPPAPAVLVWKETWENVSGNIPMTQEHVTNKDLKLEMFTGKEEFHITAEGNVPHIWNGEQTATGALVLSHNANYVDLTGKGRIRWYIKTSGFHEVRPVLRLADGSYVIGDHVDAYPFDYHESEFYLSEVKWLKLDMPKVLTKGKLLDKVDLSKVDAIGYADLSPGSGHGDGGYSDVGWIEVYGKAVPREAK